MRQITSSELALAYSTRNDRDTCANGDAKHRHGEPHLAGSKCWRTKHRQLLRRLPPYGSSTWISGGTVTSPSATVSGLTNGQKYEFGVSAIASDGTSSDLGTTTGTPSTVLPLRIKGARHASSSLPKSGRTRVVGSATTSSAGRVKTTVRCRVTSTSGRGDMGFCTYTVRSNGRVTVTTLGHRGVVVTVTQQAVPKKGKTGYTSSAKWVRSWRTR